MTELENSVLVGHRISIEEVPGDFKDDQSETMILYNTFQPCDDAANGQPQNRNSRKLHDSEEKTKNNEVQNISATNANEQTDEHTPLFSYEEEFKSNKLS